MQISGSINDGKFINLPPVVNKTFIIMCLQELREIVQMERDKSKGAFSKTLAKFQPNKPLCLLMIKNFYVCCFIMKKTGNNSNNKYFYNNSIMVKSI